MVEANGDSNKQGNQLDPENQNGPLLNKQTSDVSGLNLIDDEEARQNEELKKLNQELELGESKC